MITAYLTQHDLSNEQTEAAERRMYLDELAADPYAQEGEFWTALMNAAIATVREHPAIEDWPETFVRPLGGGACVRQDSYANGDDALVLEIERDGISATLATVGYYHDGRYHWVRNRTAYARNVRGFRRSLRRRENALAEAVA